MIYKNQILVFIIPFLIAGFLIAIPKGVMAGGTQGSRTDEGDNFVVGYWDLRERESFFQLTNVTGAAITVHIQIWNASDPLFTSQCVEFDFIDTYTGFDTHIYNIRNLTRNDGGALAPPILDDGHGYIYASTTTPGVGCDDDDALLVLLSKGQ